ncbi:MAG: CspA family cold shock protein [Candidatus Paceibacteria bacterium]|jgi:CspA family cold shock protein
METGIIARLNNGYGFITREGSDKDLFFHVNELSGVQFDDLREGDKVSFEVGEGPKGPNAVKVTLVAEGGAEEAAPATEEAA